MPVFDANRNPNDVPFCESPEPGRLIACIDAIKEIPKLVHSNRFHAKTCQITPPNLLL